MQAPLEFDELPIPTNRGKMSAKEIVCWLTYRNYAFNRRRGMTPERLAAVLGPQAARLEEFYQRELARERQQNDEKRLADLERNSGCNDA